MWGVIPAAGRGTRIQPLAFSKELLPLVHRNPAGLHEPCAVSELLMQRMVRAGADKICVVIGRGKSDILDYHGARYEDATLAYVVQPEPAGLCDAIFRAAPVIAPDEHVVVGLPDTVWFPEDGLARLPRNELSFLLFPVEHPEFFDAVLLGDDDSVREIRVKTADPGTHWIWGAFGMPARVFHALRALWLVRGRVDEYLGPLVNEWLARGNSARGVRAGTSYVDVGTLSGYRDAMTLLTNGAGDAATPAAEART
jgi:glucose-1-phosphate thymidylyltransferase